MLLFLGGDLALGAGEVESLNLLDNVAFADLALDLITTLVGDRLSSSKSDSSSLLECC